ncbi:MAG TPA: hypothetical protein VFW65_09845 [Pseudonocardiaceae bacterium]|nr:hypothetical protein [Pseudonocardiaceae bacterium]
MENPELPEYPEPQYPRRLAKPAAGVVVTVAGVILACVLIVGGLFVVGYIVLFVVAMNAFGSNK